MKKSIKNISSATLFGSIILFTITAVFIVAGLLMPSKDVDAAGASMDTNPAPIEKVDSDENIIAVPNTKWGAEDYSVGCKLVYDRNTGIVMYKTYGYRGAADVLQPMLGPNGLPCRLEGNKIIETQTNQFVLSTE